MPHLDLGAYLADDALTLDNITTKAHPDGKSYTIASPSAEDGLRLQRIMGSGSPDAAREADDPSVADDYRDFCRDADGNDIDFETKLMGPTRAELITDGVSASALSMIETVVLTHFALGEGVSQRIVAAAAGEAAARLDRASQTPTTSPAASTQPTPDGSKSSPASSVTPARTRARTSGSSSTTPARKQAARKRASA